MVFLVRKKQKFVRIKIGNCETGHQNIMAPIKTINIPNTSVDEVNRIITKALKKELKKKSK